jgi:murein DD-endopeptidase MepM/ murein hydrolase activator NlpD
MARVPVVQGNSIERDGITSARIRPADNDGGALGALGKGMEQLGQAGTAYADNQVALAENRVKDLDLQYSAGAAQIRQQYGALQGKEALIARPDTEAALKKLRDRLYGEAKGFEQGLFAKSVDQRYALDLGDIDIHATRQGKVYGEGLSAARIDQAQSDAIAAREVPARFNAYLGTGLTEIDALIKSKGLSPEQARLEKSKFVSSVHSAVVRELLVDDVDGAKAYLSVHGNEIEWKDRTALREALQPALERRESSSDGDRAMGMATQDDVAPVQYGDPLRGGGTGVSSPFGEARGGGKTHNGVDFTAPKGTPIYAVAPGRVIKASHDPRSGNFVIIDHGNGMTTSYSHMDGHKVEVGDEVTADTQLGGVGMTGHTTGPHLHFVTKQNGQTVDPQKVVGKARQNPREHDLTELLARVDSLADREGWSFERRDRAKSEVERRVGRDEKLLSREQEDASRDALDVVDKLGERFTNISQIPPAILNRMSSKDRISLRGQAEQNAKPKEVPANGEVALGLSLLAAGDTQQFLATDIRKYRSQMTRAEFAQLAELQVKARTNPKAPAVVQHEAIWGMINRYAPDIELTVGAKAKPEDRAKAQKLFGMMQADLSRITSAEKRAPTDDEVKAAFDRATIKVTLPGTEGWFSGPDQARLFEAEQPNVQVPIPASVKDRIRASYQRQFGRAPSETAIAQTYVANKGKPGFWN